MRLFLVGLSIALAEDVPLLRGSNLTKPSNLTKAASSDAEDVTPSNLTKSAASGRIIGKDVLYDKIMGYWVPLSAFDTPSISFNLRWMHCYRLVAYSPHFWTQQGHFGSSTCKTEVGQLVGNFMGLPFEFQYNNEPMPFEPKTYYDLGSARSAGLRVNTDGRGRIPQRLSQLQGGIFNKLSI